MRSKPVPIVAAAAALLAAGAAAFAVVRRRRRADPPPRTEPGAPSLSATYTCECGHELERRGEGRHVVYWEAGADLSDPLLDPLCPACGRDLPHEHPGRVA